MNYSEASMAMHRQLKGKIEVISKVDLSQDNALALAYTPGVAAPCLAIQADPEQSFELTRRHNLCLVVTDGSAVLGLGNIGPEAGMPVMEGKCVLLKEMADVDGFPLCIDSYDVDEIVRTVHLISKSFGAINLEDIAAPRCFEIEKRLKAMCDIPVFHDDQHGTAIVVLAGLINALKIVDKDRKKAKLVISGAGAAGTSICKLLLSAGFADITLCDIHGTVWNGREEGMNPTLTELSKVTNKAGVKGTLAEVVSGADIFIGVSAPGLLTKDMVATMNDRAIVFACANPTPEITPEEALAGGAEIIATGRSDFPNQVNNVLAFPGIFRGALDVRARDINEAMKMAAAQALAGLIDDHALEEGRIIPDPLDPRVSKAVAEAVARAGRESGVARR